MEMIINGAMLGLIFLIGALFFTIKNNKKQSLQKTNQSKFVKGILDSDNAEDYRSKHNKRGNEQFAFAAVSIAHDKDHACGDVQALGNVRFLSRDAPLIPLKNCAKKATCNCRYVHHRDRRKSQRRNTFNSVQNEAVKYERRAIAINHGRRSTDK